MSEPKFVVPSGVQLLGTDGSETARLEVFDTAGVSGSPGIALLTEDGLVGVDASGEVSLPAATVSGGTVSGGVVRRAHSVLVDWTHDVDTVPTDVALGTAFHVDVDVTVDNGGSDFGTSHFGPRGIVNVEGLVRYNQDMTALGFAPPGPSDLLTVANEDSVAHDLVPAWTFIAARSTIADGATCKLANTDINAGGAAFVETPILGSMNGGSLDGITNDSEWIGFFSHPSVAGSVSLARRVAFDAGPTKTKAFLAGGQDHHDVAGTIDALSVTMTEEIGLRVQQFTYGTTKIGVRSVHPVIAEEGFYGDDASGGDLILGSTTHATSGVIRAVDPLQLIDEDVTWTDTTEGLRVLRVLSSRTITLNDTSGGLSSGNAILGYEFAPTVVFAAPGNAFTSGQLFNNQAVLTNDNGSARAIATFITVNAAPTLQADGATLTAGGHVAFRENTRTTVINAGTGSISAVTGFASSPNIAASTTVTTRKGVNVADPGGSGTITTQVGVDVAALTRATTNIGLRNASTEVATPTTATLTAVGDTISATAKTVELDNTSGGSLTLTSAPTIPDGEDGQILVLVNTSADNVVLRDQGTLASSNLRLSANSTTLSTRDSLMLMFSATVGDWIEIGQVNVT